MEENLHAWLENLDDERAIRWALSESSKTVERIKEASNAPTQDAQGMLGAAGGILLGNRQGYYFIYRERVCETVSDSRVTKVLSVEYSTSVVVGSWGGSAPREPLPRSEGPRPLCPMPCDPALEVVVLPMKVWARSKSLEDALKHAKQPKGAL